MSLAGPRPPFFPWTRGRPIPAAGRSTSGLRGGHCSAGIIRRLDALGRARLCSVRLSASRPSQLIEPSGTSPNACPCGFPVLRFDPDGTGDSAGSDEDPGRVRAWIDSLKTAVLEVQGLSGATEVSLLGLRLGAALAVLAATELGGVASLVLWAPVTSGSPTSGSCGPCGSSSNRNDLEGWRRAPKRAQTRTTSRRGSCSRGRPGPSCPS